MAEGSEGANGPGRIGPAPAGGSGDPPAWLGPLIAALLGTGVFFGLGFAGVFDLPLVLALLPSGIAPAATSLELTSLSFLIGFALALPLGMLRARPPATAVPGSASARSPARRGLRTVAYRLASGYVGAIRGTPFLVQVFLVYWAVVFTVPRLTIFGVDLPFWVGLLALTINTTAYQSEALRGGFQSVDAGQLEAARAIGLTPFEVFARVLLPQGIRLVTLPLANEWISNFKTSTILSYITVVELYYWARNGVALDLARPVEAFVLLTVFYLSINVTLSRTVTYLEHRYRIPGLGTPPPGVRGRAGPLVTAAPH